MNCRSTKFSCANPLLSYGSQLLCRRFTQDEDLSARNLTMNFLVNILICSEKSSGITSVTNGEATIKYANKATEQVNLNAVEWKHTKKRQRPFLPLSKTPPAFPLKKICQNVKKWVLFVFSSHCERICWWSLSVFVQHQWTSVSLIRPLYLLSELRSQTQTR